MTRVRTIGVALGLVLLMGIGAATLSRGQPPASDAPRRSSPDLATREAEVELLQIEHDVARENLRDFLKKCEHVQTFDKLGVITPIGMTLLFEKTFTGEAPSTDSTLAKGLAMLGEKESKEIEATASKDVKRLFDALRLARERMEQDFVNRTKTFNARKRALADARSKESGAVR